MFLLVGKIRKRLLKGSKEHLTLELIAITDFVEALEVWLINCTLIKSALLGIMADDGVDVANMEGLSDCCRWVENGVPVSTYWTFSQKSSALLIYSVLLD